MFPSCWTVVSIVVVAVDSEDFHMIDHYFSSTLVVDCRARRAGQGSARVEDDRWWGVVVQALSPVWAMMNRTSPQSCRRGERRQTRA